jgi:hypothetical protein
MPGSPVSIDDGRMTMDIGNVRGPDSLWAAVTLRAAPGQCLGAAWPGRMPAETRRTRRISDGAKEARGCARDGRRADYLVMHVSNQARGSEQLLRLSGTAVLDDKIRVRRMACDVPAALES